MSNLSLHTTIRQVIEKHGQGILSDLRLMYILSDYGAFDKLSDEHAIVKDLQTAGYGQLLLDCKNNSDADWQSKAEVFINDFISSHRQFDSAEAIYICDSIAYGLDLLPETAVRVIGSPKKPSSSNTPIDYAAELQRLKNEYLALLKSSIVVPEGKLFKKPSGYFPVDAQNKLYLLEQKIWMLGQELGQDLESWCKTEKQKVLDEHSHPVAPQRWGLFSVVAAPAVAVIILVSNLVSYLGAKESISVFDRGIAHADSLYQAKDYLAAADAYKLAGSTYKESYKQSKYKNTARSGEQKAISSLVYDYLNKAQPLYDQKDYFEAFKVLNSMPEGVDCSFDNKLEKRLTAMKTDLATKCEMLITSEMDGFITAISKNKGKPSGEVLARIDYLLTVDPSNYWLNFIKNKSAVK